VKNVSNKNEAKNCLAWNCRAKNCPREKLFSEALSG
jgi:hypothetical protein